MRKTRVFIVYWLPLILWMAVIFGASGDASSFQHSSRFLGPFVHWLFPHLADDTVKDVVTIVRKCAHLTEYAILAWLVWRFVRQPIACDTRPWRWSEAIFALVFTILYAVTDEIHQRYVPSRQASVADVLLDSLGAAAGLFVLWMTGRWLKRW